MAGHWVPAWLLRAGDIIQTREGPLAVASCPGRKAQHACVYNLEIEGAHTYFVSSAGLLVHNTCRPTRFVSTDQGIVDVQPTLDRIESGGSFPHANDGSTFQNRPLPGKATPELPPQAPDYYTEYVHPTPGTSGPGPQRIVTGEGGEIYYTKDHYRTFIRIK